MAVRSRPLRVRPSHKDDVEERTISEHRRTQNRLAQRRFRKRRARQKQASQCLGLMEMTSPGSWIICSPSISSPSVAAIPPVSDDDGVPYSVASHANVDDSFIYSPSLQSGQDDMICQVEPDSIFIDGINALDAMPQWEMPSWYWPGAPAYEPSDMSMTQMPPSPSTLEASSYSPCVSLDSSTSTALYSEDMPFDVRQSGFDALDIGGETPMSFDDAFMLQPILHNAVLTGMEASVRFLIGNGINLDEQDLVGNGETALHLALRTRQVDIARLLLQHGADSCVPDFNGTTPLHQVVMDGYEQGMQLMLNHNPGEVFGR